MVNGGDRAGAAALHNSYAERDSAVARLESPAKFDGSGDSADALSQPVAAYAYVERDNAVAHDEAGARVLFTNISQDPGARKNYWRKNEDHERKAGESSIQLILPANDPFWQAARSDNGCPPIFQRLIVEAETTGRATIVPTADAKRVRAWIERRPGYDEARPPAAIRVARSGHVQYRIHGSLPQILSLEGKVKALRSIADEFEGRNLPYVAVLHAPDHYNDGRNWHYYIIYHDRPAKLMKDGRWDFETSKAIRDSRGRPSRGTLAQPKVREVSKKDWIPALRSRVAELINEQLAAEDHGLRVDARSHADMGVVGDAQEYLGSKGHALERMGIETPKGKRNADRFWASEVAAVEARRVADLSVLRADEQSLRIAVGYTALTYQRAARLIHDFVEEASLIVENTAKAALLDLAHRRDQSRAQLVADTCTKLLDAVGRGNATRAEMASEAETRRRLHDANEHLASVDRTHAVASAAAEQHRDAADVHAAHRDEHRRAITKLLSVDTAAKPIAQPFDVKPRPYRRTSDGVAPTMSADEYAAASRPEAKKSGLSDRIEAAMAELAGSNVRIQRERSAFMMSHEFMEERGVPAHIVGSQPMQKRLQALAAVQKMELARLTHYVDDHPAKLEYGTAGYMLVESAPPDLLALHGKWGKDPQV